jgi:hypothetical protein
MAKKKPPRIGLDGKSEVPRYGEVGENGARQRSNVAGGY